MRRIEAGDPMTERQAEIYRFMLESALANGRAPTVRAVMRTLAFARPMRLIAICARWLAKDSCSCAA